jgi:hypothetical protein
MLAVAVGAEREFFIDDEVLGVHPQPATDEGFAQCPRQRREGLPAGWRRLFGQDRV